MIRLHYYHYHNMIKWLVLVVMPSMAYLLLPFKCLVFNLYFIFFFVLTIERDMARSNMNTHRGEEDNEIYVDNLFNNFLLIDSFSFIIHFLYIFPFIYSWYASMNKIINKIYKIICFLRQRTGKKYINKLHNHSFCFDSFRYR
jgi:magnesium-transporting ATPase (P-type)